LSRLQDDPVRLKSYFLKGFCLVLGVTLPITIACGLFGDDVVFVLSFFWVHSWKEAAAIVRLLSPAIAIFAIINPLGWLIFSIGRVARGMKAAPVLATIMITGYVIGLHYGPRPDLNSALEKVE
jgi:O-antigen/teichoic acid export membrane protein